MAGQAFGVQISIYDPFLEYAGNELPYDGDVTLSLGNNPGGSTLGEH